MARIPIFDCNSMLEMRRSIAKPKVSKILYLMSYVLLVKELIATMGARLIRTEIRYDQL